MGLKREQEEERIWGGLSPALISQGIIFLQTMEIYEGKAQMALQATTTGRGNQQEGATQQETSTIGTRKGGQVEAGAVSKKGTSGNLTNNSKANQTGGGGKGTKDP